MCAISVSVIRWCVENETSNETKCLIRNRSERVHEATRMRSVKRKNIQAVRGNVIRMLLDSTVFNVCLLCNEEAVMRETWFAEGEL